MIGIVIPTYNESENLENLVNQILKLDLPVTIIIVDDNSPDRTGEIADRLAASYSQIKVIHRQAKLGLGTAYKAGFDFALKAKLDHVLTMDADFSHHPSFIPDIIKYCDSYDIVIGSRYVENGTTTNFGLHRKFISRSANFFAHWILGMTVNDCTAGFRCYKLDSLKKVPLDKIRSNGYSFLVEMLYYCQKCDLSIKEIPINFIAREQGLSKISKKEIFNALKTIFRLKWQHF
ncbi:MAG: hypothetical protein A2161_07720 [Candidatus Schekmanbacteria bacterium RBG_13_48_7]|uniref:Glycosyltransferase 2-like domain-containing protein n=1 Tax=Candidatus Schekmanbacteria bacterium RBG_13_48_7 TaxID=1817878 RepID=A0A1F7RY56_9BACT|nr:MAG: hypothetical protein A2161_07720 [Candidatus Schekmanbacteria bacterium RBG_13_48_7]